MEAYKRGSHTDEMWVDYIKNQTPPEPDDNFNVTQAGAMSAEGGPIRR
jgi:hypothetical protein